MIPVERYSFVAVTTSNLVRAKVFWAAHLGFPILQEEPGHFFIVDAGGLRLCIDLADTVASDTVIGLKVASVEQTLEALARHEIRPAKGPLQGAHGKYAEIHDPDGRTIVLTEAE